MESNKLQIVCTYCSQSFGTTDETVAHCAEAHEEENISFTWPKSCGGKVIYQRRTFKVKGCEILGNKKELAFNPLNGKLQIPIKTNKQSESPVRKVLRINTPTKSVHRQLYSESDTCGTNTDLKNLSDLMEETAIYGDSDSEENEPIIEAAYNINVSDGETMFSDAETVQNAVKYLKKLLPAVTAHLAEQGRLDDWLSFFKLVDNGEFSVNHIAAQLFLDVVQFTVIKDVRSMRYTQEVKQFWSVGQSLFRAKFLRFMGGYKTFSRLNEHGITDEKMMSKTDASMINFACPNKNVLVEEKKKYSIDCDKPGIIRSNLEAVSVLTDKNDKAFSLCVDGKKLTSGFGKSLGEVDLFGHESEPTNQQKKDRLEVELSAINKTIQEISKWIERDVALISDLSTDSKKDLYSYVLDIISINTERMKELRQLKVKMQMSLEKLLKMEEEPWQKSKYSFAISSIKTRLHEINRCINDALELNGKLGLVAAACNDASSNYTLANLVDLTYQGNYVCVNPWNQYQTNNGVEIPTRFIEQRSEQWHYDRKQTKVTGSTIFKALGLKTLKEQQEHYESVKDGSSNGNEASLSNATNEAMKYGVENELNAVGTLASKILPVLAPSTSLHEEGYYKIAVANISNFLIVSPDGSCREEDQVKFAIEIKYPVPGKKYTPDVHYAIPKYYVTQILAEMAALGCKELLYLSWPRRVQR